MTMRVEAEGGTGKMSKNNRRVRRKTADMCAVENSELEQNLKVKVRNKKMKNKGNHMVYGDLSVNGERNGNLNTDSQSEKLKKEKKKKKNDKRVLVLSEEVTDCLDALPPEEANSFSLTNKEEKLKIRNKHDVHKDLLPVQDEGHTSDSRKRQTKKRGQLETCENKDASTKRNETGAWENIKCVGNLEQQLMRREGNVHGKKPGNDGEKRSCRKEGTNKTESNGETKRRMSEENDNDTQKRNSTGREDVENFSIDCDMLAVEKVKMKKRKKEMVKTNKDVHIKKAQDTEPTSGAKRKWKKVTSTECELENSKPTEGKQKKVRFSKHIEVFPSSDMYNSGNEEKENDGLIRGKRFSREEDEIVIKAVEDYIDAHCLGEKGVEMVMNCISHSNIRNCWKKIAAAIPNRPYTAVYHRAHILFEWRAERHEWTGEELERLEEEVRKHGENWKMLAKEFKRHNLHLKDTWRRIKIKRNKGKWSQEEYQNLFNLVNYDIRLKVDEDKKSKHGMLRDNIPWSAISDRLSTRSNSSCCSKWYNQLTSSMVAQGIWADSDDYRLLGALYNLDACCIDDVDWDYLIKGRSGDVCRKRWDQMLLHIGLHGNKSFAEQVEVLAKRYRPELLEPREAWENKPLVP